MRETPKDCGKELDPGARTPNSCAATPAARLRSGPTRSCPQEPGGIRGRPRPSSIRTTARCQTPQSTVLCYAQSRDRGRHGDKLSHVKRRKACREDPGFAAHPHRPYSSSCSINQTIPPMRM